MYKKKRTHNENMLREIYLPLKLQGLWLWKILKSFKQIIVSESYDYIEARIWFSQLSKADIYFLCSPRMLL